MIHISVRVKKYDNVTDPRLGRIIEHDERSKQYPFRARKAASIVSRRWKREVPVFNQGNLGSCTGNASVGCVGTDPFWSAIQSVLALKSLTLNEPEAVAVYSAATAIDEYPGTYPPDDTGSSGLAVAKVIQGLGLISGYQHIFSFDDLLAALQSGPVIVGTDWYESMFTPGPNGILSIDWKNVAGGHEYIIDEVDVERQLIGMQNSWGDGWGIGGRSYFTFADFKKLLENEGDATVFVPITAPAPQPEPVTPTPSPEPVPPVPTDSDAALYEKVKDWAHARHTGTNKTAAKNVLAWAAEKGYTSS